MHSTPKSKPAGNPASQAFCNAKPWRRRNLVPPSKSNHRRVKHPAGVWSPKKDTTYGRVFFWWTRSDSNRRPPQCECDALPTALQAQKNYTTHYNHFSQACQGHFYRQAGHSQGWVRSLDPEKGNAAALVHIPLFTRSPVAVKQQLALLAYFSKRFRRYPYPSAFIFA